MDLETQFLCVNLVTFIGISGCAWIRRVWFFFFNLLYMLGIAFQGFNLCVDFFLYMIEIVLQLEHHFLQD